MNNLCHYHCHTHRSPAQMFGKKVGMVSASRSLWWSMSNVPRDAFWGVQESVESQWVDFKTTTALAATVFSGDLTAIATTGQPHFQAVFVARRQWVLIWAVCHWLRCSAFAFWCWTAELDWIGIPRRGRPKTSTKTSTKTSKNNSGHACSWRSLNT